jgi:CDP-paratose 2-epimerase
MPRVVLVTGSAGLVGSACVRAFSARGEAVLGVDADLRATFFGADASTASNTDASCSRASTATNTTPSTCATGTP